MEFHTGDGARWVLAIWLAALGVAGAALCGVLAGLFSSWLLLGSGLIALVTLFAALWYPPRYARSLTGRCESEAVRARKGVLWKQELYIPVSSLRTVESWVTPLQRLFRCRTIMLRFAGGAAVLPLPPEKQAAALVDLLERLAAQDEPG